MDDLSNTLYITVLLITTVIFGLAVFIRMKYFLHMIQLEGYKNKEYKKWIKEFTYKVFSKRINISFIVIVLISALYIITYTSYKGNLLVWLSYIVVWSVSILLSIKFKKEKTKKDLVLTKRAKRLFASNIIVVLLEVTLIHLLYYLVLRDIYFYPIVLFGLAFIYYQVPNNMIISNILVSPIEKRINKYYYDLAYDKVRKYDNLNIVGITGSYGKTTTKYITSTILNEKYKTLKTPESYNTPMGISKVINNTLNDEHEAFVVEMGARKKGDIKEDAMLANPSIGVLTAIGPTHLETFKSIENIMKTKYELIEELPSEGIAIFNYDNKYVRRLADKTFKEKILYGLEDTEDLDLFAKDITVNEQGSSFLLCDSNGDSIRCETKLLGKHNILNLLAGAAVGKTLGLSLEQIARGIKKVEPVPHRLQLINSGTGVIVIDDAFNSNPVGANAALEVINKFKDGRKIIITPGMIELGKEEYNENKKFGQNIATICDYAILIGEKRTKPIYEGLINEGYKRDRIFVVNSLDEATKKLQEVVKAKDVVLFENDLPDTYNE